MTTQILIDKMTRTELEEIILKKVKEANDDLKSEEKEDLIDVTQAAKKLSVCPQTIRNLYSKQQIARYRVGRRVLVNMNELLQKVKSTVK